MEKGDHQEWFDADRIRESGASVEKDRRSSAFVRTTTSKDLAHRSGIGTHRSGIGNISLPGLAISGIGMAIPGLEWQFRDWNGRFGHFFGRFGHFFGSYPGLEPVLALTAPGDIEKSYISLSGLEREFPG